MIRRFTWAAVATLGAAAGASAASRYDELRKVIDRNTGFAHMTRGMNMYTLIALRSCVSDVDLPVLRAMLFDRDYVTQISAAGVLADLGPAGRGALEDSLKEAKDSRARQTIRDALKEAGDPQRRPLAEYPMSDRERRAIRGCRSPR